MGVLVFVGCQLALFVGLTWLALGARTGIWRPTYLWCLPLIWLQFAIFYSFSILAAVMTRSAVACAFGSLLFWLLAWATNCGCALRGRDEWRLLDVRDARPGRGGLLAVSQTHRRGVNPL